MQMTPLPFFSTYVTSWARVTIYDCYVSELSSVSGVHDAIQRMAWNKEKITGAEHVRISEMLFYPIHIKVCKVNHTHSIVC